jgi:hypothetical protein
MQSQNEDKPSKDGGGQRGETHAHFDITPAPASDGGAINPEPPPAKRKRGRPPKKPQPT